jgi:hypothetical protein
MHTLHSHMSCLNFWMKPSFDCVDDDLSNGAFIWASKHIGGRDVMEEFIACNVWPLVVGISFEQVKVDVTPVSKLKVLLPRFVVAHEDDAKFLARVEKEPRVLVGSYTCPEHEACATLPNNNRLNRILELTGVAYGPRPVPVSVEVLKKRKADSIGKTVPKRPKALEKKRAEPVKTSTTPVKIGVKRPSNANVASPKSVKLSKKTIPHAIASAAAAHGTLLAFGLKTMPGALDLVTTAGHPYSKTIRGTSGSKTAGGVLVSKGAAGSKKAGRLSRNIMFPGLGPWLGHLQKSLKTHHHVVQ